MITNFPPGARPPPTPTAHVTVYSYLFEDEEPDRFSYCGAFFFHLF